jgi:transposase
LRAGIQQVRVILRALALEQLSQGLTAPAVARIAHLTPQPLRRVGHRYKRGGLESALFQRQGRGAKQLLDESQKQRIIAMVCSAPLQSFARWTVRLVAEQTVKRKLVPRVDREMVRILLLSYDLKPWRGKMWCVAELDPEYIEKMQDVSATCEKPYHATEPVVCLDEKPISLPADVGPPAPAC